MFEFPPEYSVLDDYLGQLKADLAPKIQQKTYQPQDAAAVPKIRGPQSSDAEPFAHPIHRLIRQIEGLAQGGEGASAQIAAVNKRSKVIHNIHRVLLKGKEPIVLLGDPGMGKTMTLQEVAKTLCEVESQRVFPTITLYLRLGDFHAAGDPTEKDVKEFVQQRVPTELRPYLEGLRSRRRLIVLFDGLDEMSRERYNAHVGALNSYGTKQKGRVRCMFTCRITDFSPNFTHKQMVLLPFNRRQIEEFLLQHVANFPIVIEGKVWTARGLARQLAKGDLPMEPTNPFVLFLLCGFLGKEQRWPTSRVHLMDFYCRENFERKRTALLPGELKFSPIDACLDAWGRIAFKITCENCGPNIAVSALEGIGLPSENLVEFIRVAKQCGLLNESRDESEHLIRFEHHRFQEFFAARHIQKEQPIIEWLQLLDAPRWQETMFNVVLLGAGGAAIRSLAEAITGPTDEQRRDLLMSDAAERPNQKEKLDGGETDDNSGHEEKRGELEFLLRFLMPPSSSVSTPSEPSAKPASGLGTLWASPRIGELIADYSGGTRDSAADEEWLRLVESRCKGALQQFQLQSKLCAKALTPNAALLKFQGSANLTVEQILKRRSEFLTTHGLNVISVRAEPGIVAIAVARPNRRILQLADVWKSWHPDCSQGNCSLLIGVKEEDSSSLFLSPKSNAPHTLIAGSTGSGKSVLMQNIVLGISCTNTPEQAKIILIDPKLGVDYFAFEGLPHLQGGIIDDQDKAIQKLEELLGEMNRRYTVLKANKVANIFDLNKKPDATERLPFLWIIHDEFAEWMMTESYADAVSNIVSRLGVKARAAGIALVFAAQRPDANVMPMQLRSNLGNRLVLRVDGEGTSEIALGEKGAERLLGKGHMAAKLEGEPDIVLAQVPFVDESFLASIVNSLSSSVNPS